MKRFAIALAVMLFFSPMYFSQGVPVAAAREATLLQFNTMVGVPPLLTGAQSQAPLRGINGGGLPWMLTSARGNLTASGHLKILVNGLVFASGPNTGSNTVGSFRALVSCVQSDGTFDNILTAAFPATLGAASAGGGDAEIETTVSLPDPCIAPIVFVTSPGGSWFAVTGN